jgi:hypothetical protein
VDLLMDSRDGFTRSRAASLSVPLVSVRRRGGTDLLSERSWRSVDSLSVHVDYLIGSTEIPLGWGAAETRRLPVAQRGDHGGSLRSNPAASRRALRALRPRELYRGVPEIRDVVTPARQDDRRLRYSVALQIPREQVLTPDRLLLRSGIDSPDGTRHPVGPVLPSTGLHAQGSAEVYFHRPIARRDRRTEYPSLFNPYWQARLVAVNGLERQLTASSRDLAVDPYGVLP